ncbi:MAG: ATP-binding cassette domain-containing protein [Anaerolineales bacterium]|nr:ATP-binding cassette domain-containing protein [Anaerolineales bacterium]
MEKLIEARDIRKSFGDTTAVDGLSLTVHGGEIYALVGPDGAGKTTTMRLLCGAYSIEAGTVTLAGIDLQRETERARAQIGYLPQRFSLYGELTVLENLRFFAEVRGLPTENWQPRSKEILRFVGLEAFGERRADALSGGMKQKLGLATALIHQPRILLLDEPTGGVDAVTRQAFWQLLIELLQEGVAVLISTPYMDEAARCSKVGFLSEGSLLLEGPPGKIVERLRGRIVEFFGGPRSLVERLTEEDASVEDVRAFGDRLHLRVAPRKARDVVAMLKTRVPKEGGVVESVRTVKPGLEDVFLEILEQSEGRDA